MATHHKTPLVIDMPLAVEAISTPLPQQAAWIDGALFYGLLALLMFGPLAYGGTVAWAQFLARVTALVLFALWAVRQYFQRMIELPANPVYLPAAIFAALVLIQFVSGVTSYRYATLENGLDLIPLGVIVLLAGEIFTRRHRLQQGVMALSLFGFAVALFAIVQDFSGNGSIYWIVKVHAISAEVYGPYANHNHYAGLMEMLVPLCAAAAFLEVGGKRALFLFASAVMALSIVFSRSRGGMLGLAVAVVFVCAILFRGHRQHRAALALLATSVLVAVGALFLGNDKILHRLTDTQDKFRLAIYSDSLHMWLQRPFVGFGWGTFPTVYPAFRSFYINMLVNHAHNDYLELLVEMGIVGAAVAAWFLVGVFRQGFRKAFDKTDYEGSMLALGGMTAIVALLAHSVLDFNLHIPGNAALFSLLCSAVATPYRRRIRQLAFIDRDHEEEETVAAGGVHERDNLASSTFTAIARGAGAHCNSSRPASCLTSCLRRTRRLRLCRSSSACFIGLSFDSHRASVAIRLGARRQVTYRSRAGNHEGKLLTSHRKLCNTLHRWVRCPIRRHFLKCLPFRHLHRRNVCSIWHGICLQQGETFYRSLLLGRLASFRSA